MGNQFPCPNCGQMASAATNCRVRGDEKIRDRICLACQAKFETREVTTQRIDELLAALVEAMPG